ncbi:MAG TPA: histidine--tRNA ligase [Saprospiraceae bacterium]|nr:histidine--tRNA ligase [Saprospiraceae bacterium]
MKAGLAKGTRDFLPEQVRKRNYIFSTIREVFSLFGYQALETPAMEQLDTLMGKYGEEGDKLLFKILNSGDYLKDCSSEELQTASSQNLLKKISEKGLRYDLTVPFARVVAMNQHLISFPFKRFQIQPVWRADRPQRGRYREFYQCDADVVGSNSLVYEAELMQIYDMVFAQLGLPVKILINHRAILEGLAVQVQAQDQFIQITAILDKLDKIGQDGVRNVLYNLGLNPDQCSWILNQIEKKKIEDYQFNDHAIRATEELQKVFHFLKSYSFKNELVFDPSLARGLSYYTGCIFEVVPTQAKMGSLGGGGRYDNLTGVFGLKGVSGVGISFGADRIYDVLEEANVWPDYLDNTVKAMILSLDELSLEEAMIVATHLRSNKIAVEIYPELSKMKKQFAHAEALGAEYVIIIGETERNEKMYNVKNQKTGNQERLTIDGLIKLLS